MKEGRKDYEERRKDSMKEGGEGKWWAVSNGDGGGGMVILPSFM